MCLDWKQENPSDDFFTWSFTDDEWRNIWLEALNSHEPTPRTADGAFIVMIPRSLLRDPEVTQIVREFKATKPRVGSRTWQLAQMRQKIGRR